MNETTVKSIGLKYGVILGAVSIAFFLVVYLLDMVGNQALSWLIFVFIGGILFLAMKEFKEGNEGFMSFGEGMRNGMLSIGVGSLISTIFSYIFMKFIATDYLETIEDITRERLEENPNMTEEQVEQAMQASSAFMTAEASAIFGILYTVVIGLIICLIVSAIMKKDKPGGI
ncbi:MAG: DUF4199 domain-containing protein [Bacteroidota bacterium]